jgi:hypothetical protein
MEQYDTTKKGPNDSRLVRDDTKPRIDRSTAGVNRMAVRHGTKLKSCYKVQE